MGGERESVRWKGYGLSCRLISLKLRDIDKRLRYIYLYVYINIYRYKYIYIFDGRRSSLWGVSQINGNIEQLSL